MKPINFYDINLRVNGIHSWNDRTNPGNISDFPAMLNGGSIADIVGPQFSALYETDDGEFILYWSDNRADFNYKERDCSFIQFTELL